MPCDVKSNFCLQIIKLYCILYTCHISERLFKIVVLPCLLTAFLRGQSENYHEGSC